MISWLNLLLLELEIVSRYKSGFQKRQRKAEIAACTAADTATILKRE